MNYCLPDLPKLFWINKFRYKCKLCGYKFEHLASNGDEIVKYQEENGMEIRWLPTYERGGYLDLVQKLIPSFKPNEKMTMKISREFSLKFKDFVEYSMNGNSFVLADSTHCCPKCSSRELELLEESTLTSPRVEWLKISCDLLDKN